MFLSNHKFLICYTPFVAFLESTKKKMVIFCKIILWDEKKMYKETMKWRGNKYSIDILLREINRKENMIEDTSPTFKQTENEEGEYYLFFSLSSKKRFSFCSQFIFASLYFYWHHFNINIKHSLKMVALKVHTWENEAKEKNTSKIQSGTRGKGKRRDTTKKIKRIPEIKQQ